jgi:hypothetical protein
MVVLDSERAVYLKCDRCGFLGVDNPTWLERAYDDAITPIDTGVVRRSRLVEELCVALFGGGSASPAIVDVGGGHGLLVRSLRDAGFDARWMDPYCENVLARGYEFKSGDTASVAVAVEVIEHATDPIDFVRTALETTGASALLFTTEVLPSPVPDENWWYYVPQTGQHVSFFERRTVRELASQLGLRARSRSSIHLLTRTTFPAWRFAMSATRLRPIWANALRRRMQSRTTSDQLDQVANTPHAQSTEGGRDTALAGTTETDRLDHETLHN